MGEVKQINIKNRIYYFYNDQINLKGFECQKSTKKITTRLTFITSIMWLLKMLLIVIIQSKSFVLNDYWNDWSLWRKNENRYLVLDDVDEKNEVWKKYGEVWEDVKKEIQTINGGKKVEHGKDFLKK